MLNLAQTPTRTKRSSEQNDRSEPMADDPQKSEPIMLTQMTAEIVSAYVQNNAIEPKEIPEFIGNVHRALKQTLNGEALERPSAGSRVPAIPINKSVTKDYIVCLEDGESFKFLKSHLRIRHGLAPDQYKAKWGLPDDYPMVAPSYAVKRSKIAKGMGLGVSGPKRKKENGTR